MKKVLLSAGLLFTVFLLGLTLNAGIDASSEDVTQERRSGLLLIDGMKVFGRLERPPVWFPHDIHWKRTAEAGKDCTACHENRPTADGGGLAYRFKRLADSDADTVRDLYHGACIGCHEKTLSKGDSSGPVACAACHAGEPPYTPAQAPMGFDRSLHYRHAKAAGNNCEKCHHEYDAAAKKLVYIKGREGTCRYCHTEATVENRISMRAASHRACITCHREATAGGRTAGPFECAGCHSLDRQARIATVENSPRYERGQPDAALILPLQPGEKPGVGRPVPFDHLGHESAVATCRTCHHADLGTCAACHTIDGIEKGGAVNLMQAMHRPSAAGSCIGCHQRRTKAAACAGCHGTMARGEAAEQSCATCHQEWAAPDVNPVQMTDAEKRAIAKAMLEKRAEGKPAVPLGDVDETVVIGTDAGQYKAVRLPHRKMFAALRQAAVGSRLANRFHNGEITLCGGCHHNSTVGLKPPPCASCHNRPDVAANPLMPGLRGAYHQQCIGCHQTMEIKKTGCTDCHEKNENS